MGNNQTDLNNSGNQVENVPVWVFLVNIISVIGRTDSKNDL